MPLQNTIPNIIRNFIVNLLMFSIGFAITITISGVAFTLMESPTLITNDFFYALQNGVPYKMLQLYASWWYQNSEYITFVSYDYFALKYSMCLIIPLIIYGYIIFKSFAWIESHPFFKKAESIHGEARWAEEHDIVKMGLRTKEGMVIGKNTKGYLVAAGFQHTLLFAPTGSGKGVGFVIPNLLYWKESVFVHDIKLENYELTSGWRAQQGQQVFVWNPADPDGITHCYNPIDWVSTKPGQMVDDVQKIANLILPEKEFWNNEARTLFVGVVLYLIAAPDKMQSFGEVVRTMRSDDVAQNLAIVLDTLGQDIHPVAYMNIAAFLQKADKERSGVVSTMNSGLELWANPLIDTATATSDFNITDMKKTLTTVYVGVTPDNLKRLQPLLQVFYQQATEFLTRKMPSDDEPYGVMFLLDEFPSLGKMEQFMIGIAYFRGYHVRLFLVVQDTQQLKGIYEEHGMNSFLSNSTYRITFAANNVETANLISQLCGNKTVDQISASKPKYFSLSPSSNSMSISQTQRALILPQEVIAMPRDEQIILIESSPPIKTKKIKYYEDTLFTKRLLPQVEVPKQEAYVVHDEEEGSEENNSADGYADNHNDNNDNTYNNDSHYDDGDDATTYNHDDDDNEDINDNESSYTDDSNSYNEDEDDHDDATDETTTTNTEDNTDTDNTSNNDDDSSSSDTTTDESTDTPDETTTTNTEDNTDTSSTPDNDDDSSSNHEDISDSEKKKPDSKNTKKTNKSKKKSSENTKKVNQDKKKSAKTTKKPKPNNQNTAKDTKDKKDTKRKKSGDTKKGSKNKKKSDKTEQG